MSAVPYVLESVAVDVMPLAVLHEGNHALSREDARNAKGRHTSLPSAGFASLRGKLLLSPSSKTVSGMISWSSVARGVVRDGSRESFRHNGNGGWVFPLR